MQTSIVEPTCITDSALFQRDGVWWIRLAIGLPPDERQTYEFSLATTRLPEAEQRRQDLILNSHGFSLDIQLAK